MEKFRELSYPEKMDILDYIAGASLYEMIENDGKEYRMVHAGSANQRYIGKWAHCNGLCLRGRGKLVAFCVVIYVDG